jgi:hypothetical protein
MAKNPGWHKEGNEFVLYNNKGEVVKRQSTDPKGETKKMVGVTRVDKEGKPSDVSYDVADEEARARAGEKNYEFIDPAEQFKYKGKTVGAQTKQTGYKIDPESGFYYKDIKPGKAGLDDFVRRHKDIVEAYPGGEEQWRKDQVSAGGKKNKAIDYVVDELNKRHREISGDDLVDPNKPGAYLPGVELFNLPGISKKKEEAPEKEQDITLTKKAKTEASKEDIKRYPPTPKKVGEYAPWWLQDIIKTSGAAADLARVKKYEPWQATPAVALPSATFYDPTRELAANTEAANLAMQAQQAFTNPQQLAAASSVAQGQMARNAADIMGRYNNLNVGLANQLEQQRTDIINTTNQNKANLNTQLWDKYTIANQQFDNAKAQARQNLRQSYMDAITNRAKTQALNTLYPNYYTNPMTGGFVNFKPGYDHITANKPGSDHVDAMWEKAKIMDPNDPKGMLKILMGQKGTQAEDDPNNIDAGYLRSQGYSG